MLPNRATHHTLVELVILLYKFKFKVIKAVECNKRQAIGFILANIYLFKVNNGNTKNGVKYVQNSTLMTSF